MAANRFATALHRRTHHRTFLILVYTLLEWILIALLLLHALFSTFISKFADFFGLHPPCTLCSHLGATPYATLCQSHASEVSSLTYCSRHQRLAVSASMCEDCSGREVIDWMTRTESGEKELRCSCCGVGLESGFVQILDPTWGASATDTAQKAEFPTEVEANLVEDDASVQVRNFTMDVFGVEDGRLVPVELIDSATVACNIEMVDQTLRNDASVEVVNNLTEVFDAEDTRLVPVQVIDSATVAGSVVTTSLKKNEGNDATVEILTKAFDVEEGRLVPVELIDSATMMPPLSEREVDCGDCAEPIVEFLDKGKRDAATMTDIPAIPWYVREVTEDANDLAKAMDWYVREDTEDGNDLAKAMDMGADRIEMVGIVENNPSVLSVEETVGGCWVDHQGVEDAHNLTIHEGSVEVEAVESAEQVQDTELGGDQLDRDFEEPVVDVRDMGIGSNVEMVDIVEEHPSVLPAEESVGSCLVDHLVVEDTQNGVTLEGDEDAKVVESTKDGDSREVQGVASEFESKTMDFDSNNCEVSIGSEICEEEPIDQSHVLAPDFVQFDIEGKSSEDCTEATEKCEVIETQKLDTVVNVVDLSSLCQEPNYVEREKTPDTPSSVDGMHAMHLSSLCQEPNYVEREKTPDTPSSVDGMHAMHRRFYFERRESGTESLDGSVASEMESSETLNVDQLKAALNAERKALSALYAELEEERSAAAIAANQTMAMITRLQHEKAEMQMEALQYQRMMEEQSEYDQEALQLLNELMMKREKEKHDLEMELEVYRSKVHLYEDKVKRILPRSDDNGGNATSSPSSSGEDSDDISFDCHDDCFNSLKESNQNTPIDAVIRSRPLPEDSKNLHTLDESLADFEEERVSLLEHLKALEEKLLTLDDEESSKTQETTEDISENGHALSNGDYNGSMNGFSDHLDTNINTKLYGKERSSGYRGKRLFPLFDAVNMENEDGVRTNFHETDASAEYVSEFIGDDKKLAIVEEIETIYDRLRALEADKEFVKYCMSSLRKGGKGGLLQEILQHLQDLRDVELQAMHAGDSD